MRKLDYMLKAIHEGKHLNRGWLLSVFGILPEETPPHSFTNFGIEVKHGILTVASGHEIRTIDIEDYTVGQPLFNRDDKISLVAGDLKCIKADIVSTYGLLIINALLIEYPYNGLVEYINQEITPKLINNTAYQALKRDEVTVEMHLRFENGVSAITALTQTGVPSATRKSITPNPLVATEKAKLLTEYAHRMHDPAAVAELQDKISDLDKEYLKGDPSERFFIKGKSKMSRLRTSGMYGAEPDFNDESKISVMANSLTEGWEVKDIPMLANNIRGGSFNRGANTALGGAAVKETARVFQNYTISRNDCQTKLGIPLIINEDNWKNFTGRYLIGKETPLTDDDVKKLMGKLVYLRSPAYCAEEGTTICYKCLGEVISNGGIGLNALMMTTTSSFLGIFMALMHTTALSTHKYNYLNRIT